MSPALSPAIPVFRQALGERWYELAPAIRARYDIAPFTDESFFVKGRMEDVSHSWGAKLLLPFAALLGAFVPHQGRDLPVQVEDSSRPESGGFYCHRTFRFPGRRPYVFRTVTFCSGPREITEFVRFGFGIRFKLSVHDGGLVYEGRGYVLRAGKRSLPLPLRFLVGSARVEEIPVSDGAFSVSMDFRHPWLGRTFFYTGRFLVPDTT